VQYAEKDARSILPLYVRGKQNILVILCRSGLFIVFWKCYVTLHCVKALGVSSIHTTHFKSGCDAPGSVFSCHL